MKKVWMFFGVLLVLLVAGLASANFMFAKPVELPEAEVVLPTRIVGLMVWDAAKTEYRTENVQFSNEGPPALLICEMPGSTAERPVYAVQPWQPLLAKAKREEYTSGSP
jgi:hypothetical protein